MQKKYQISLIAITLMLVCSILIASSYAYWSVTEVQEDTNILTSGCFDATLEGKNAINLDNAYPMTNEEGRNTTVYSFTIKNTCSIDSSYVVNLEALKGSNLGGNYIKILFNNDTPVLYSSLESVETVVTDSVDSKKLVSGNLIAGGSITYTLQLWMDESATTDQAGQIFDSKIIVTTEATNMSSTLARKILDSNPLVEIAPTLTTSSNNTTDPSGLYKSNLTNSGSPTYYFRGNVSNNYVNFAGFTWRIIRINEDGTIRLIMTEGINDSTLYDFNLDVYNYKSNYYTESNVKKELDNWYDTNIVKKGHSAKVATGDYFCEQARVTPFESLTIGNEIVVSYVNYSPSFTCTTDANGYGIVNASVGLITYDEHIFAGSYNMEPNTNSYLYSSENRYWIMSPTSADENGQYGPWKYHETGRIYSNIYHDVPDGIYPVINLKSDVSISGLGTVDSPYIIN